MQVYGCAPNVSVTATAHEAAAEVSVVVEADHLFVDAGGEWHLSLSGFGFEVDSDLIDGFVVLKGVRVEAVAPLLETGTGTKKIGSVESVNLSFVSSEVDVDFGDSAFGALLSLVLSLFKHLFFSHALSTVNQLLESELNAAISLLPGAQSLVSCISAQLFPDRVT